MVGTRTPESEERRARFRAWCADESSLHTLCTYVANGGHIAEFAKEHDFSYQRLYEWVADGGERQEQYQFAISVRAHKIADEILSIADEVEIKTVVDGEEVRLALDPVAVMHQRLRVDTRKWLACKLLPRVYGDKVAVSGDADAPPIQHDHQHTVSLPDMSDLRSAFTAALKRANGETIDGETIKEIDRIKRLDPPPAPAETSVTPVKPAVSRKTVPAEKKTKEKKRLL